MLAKDKQLIKASLYSPRIDIRLLPSLVPESRINDTARAIDTALLSQIAHLHEIINSGTVTLESPTGEYLLSSNKEFYVLTFKRSTLFADQTRMTSCTFTLYAQIVPSELPGFYMQELESELEHPTGITTAPRPPLKLNGVLISKDCALVYVIQEAEGLKSALPDYLRKLFLL